jgi:hypothetical protein
MEERSRSSVKNSSGANAMAGEVLGWRCSTCDNLITRIEDGWVEWLASERAQGTSVLKNLRLVHRVSVGQSGEGACRYDFRHEFRKDKSVVEGLPLARFVGPDGLMLLLSFLAAGEMPRDEVLELAKRVQIPGYEQTHERFPQAMGEGVVVPAIREGYYLQFEIEVLRRWESEKMRQNNNSRG